MAMYQNMLVVIDPNQDDQTSIAASCLFTSTDWWQN
ncbi:universal stress protein E [Escherichia coli]|nr:universal stress protein E [Escherichia coli]